MTEAADMPLMILGGYLGNSPASAAQNSKVVVAKINKWSLSICTLLGLILVPINLCFLINKIIEIFLTLELTIWQILNAYQKPSNIYIHAV